MMSAAASGLWLHADAAQRGKLMIQCELQSSRTALGLESPEVRNSYSLAPAQAALPINLTEAV
jgi:hypothetical protein